MRVFKFGGASLKDADAIRNVTSIIKKSGANNLLVVVSAMGKTTDALEKIIGLGHAGKKFEAELAAIKDYHADIIRKLFPDPSTVEEKLFQLLAELREHEIGRASCRERV